MIVRPGGRRRLLVPLVFLVGLVFAGVASAASIGPVTSTRLGGFVGTGPSGAKTVYASDSFTGANGTNLSGRALVIGQTWAVGAGTWRLNATNQAESTGGVRARAVTATGQANARIIVTVSDSTTTGITSGVLMHSDATATSFLSVYSQTTGGGRIRLAKRNGGATTLITVTGVTLTSPATWMVELNGANIRVFYNGTLYINYTLTAADQTTFGGLTSHGLLNDNSGTVQYDNFRVESL